MSLKEIKKKYLKAYNKWLEWGDGELILNEKPNFLYEQNLNNRNLYDFFDKQELRIVIKWHDVECFVFDKDLCKNIQIESNIAWSYHILCLVYSNFKTRSEAEKAAFLKAFEILENKL